MKTNEPDEMFLVQSVLHSKARPPQRFLYLSTRDVPSSQAVHINRMRWVTVFFSTTCSMARGRVYASRHFSCGNPRFPWWGY